MDRFIAYKNSAVLFFSGYLKSNMDRFIEYRINRVGGIPLIFKIQYG